MKKMLVLLSIIFLSFNLFLVGCECTGKKGYEIVTEDIGYVTNPNGKLSPCVVLEIENISDKTLSISAEINVYCDGELFESKIAGQKSGGMLVLMPGDKGKLWADCSGEKPMVQYFNHEWTYKIVKINDYYD